MSQAVIDEAAAGDATEAQKRLAVLATLGSGTVWWSRHSCLQAIPADRNVCSTKLYQHSTLTALDVMSEAGAPGSGTVWWSRHSCLQAIQADRKACSTKLYQHSTLTAFDVMSEAGALGSGTVWWSRHSCLQAIPAARNACSTKLYQHSTLTALDVMSEAGALGSGTVWWSRHSCLQAIPADRNVCSTKFFQHSTLTALDVMSEAGAPAQAILGSGVLPSSAGRDAVHVAVAAPHRVDYLLTWNCKHLEPIPKWGLAPSLRGACPHFGIGFWPTHWSCGK